MAGAPARDRRAFPRPGSVPHWFEPFHVRQPAVARGELASQVVAGADIVMAPAWLTHRRALESVGESRRAREWTLAAVRLAREAAESGLERREGGTTPVLVAGPLPDVAARPETAAGRLLPATVSAERDAHDQAGILADAEVDLVLVERRPTLEAARIATETAASTGRPVWTVIALADATGEPPLAERLTILTGSGAVGILIESQPGADARAVAPLAEAASAPEIPLLGLIADLPPLGSPEALDDWLRAGVQVLGLAAGADPSALRPLAEARDRLSTAEREQQDTEVASLEAWVNTAVERAPGGRALWLGPMIVPPPPGFEWTIIEDAESPLASLPDQAFRLAVVLAAPEPSAVARLVERGGIVAIQAAADAATDVVARLGSAGLRVQEVGSAPDGRARIICRREDG
jgi:hypothetical protein